MPRIGSSELDDWQMFYSIHVNRYLSGKRTEKIGSVAERDMINDLVREAWNSTISGVRLNTMSPKQKLALFRSVEIIFPFFEVPVERARASGNGRSPLGTGENETIEYDFFTRRRVSPDEGENTIPFRLDP
jgi:hypothetical protein